MLRKLILLAVLLIACFAIRQRDGNQLQSHDGVFYKKPYNPKNRSEQEVCQHYGGKICTVFRVMKKCCNKGKSIIGDGYCGGVGCEDETVSLEKKDWNYADDKPKVPTTPNTPNKPKP